MKNYNILAKYMNNDTIVLAGLLDEATAIVLAIDCCGEFAQLTYPAMLDRDYTEDKKTCTVHAVLLPDCYEVSQDRDAAMIDVRYILGYDDCFEGSDIDSLEEQLEAEYPGLKTTACAAWFSAFMSQLSSCLKHQELQRSVADWLQSAAKNIQHGVRYDVVLEDFYNPRTQLVLEKAYQLDDGCWAADAVDIDADSYHYSITSSFEDEKKAIVCCSTTGFESACEFQQRGNIRVLMTENVTGDDE